MQQICTRRIREQQALACYREYILSEEGKTNRIMWKINKILQLSF
jgi:hypothetical protein